METDLTLFRQELLEEVRLSIDGEPSDADMANACLEKFLDIAADSGLTIESYSVVNFDRFVGRRRVAAGLDAYAILEGDGVDAFEIAPEIQLFVSHFEPNAEPYALSDSLVEAARRRAVVFYSSAVKGEFENEKNLPPEVEELASSIYEHYRTVPHTVRIILLTDGMTRERRFKPNEAYNVTVHFEVFNIERARRGLDRDGVASDVIYDIHELYGKGLPLFYTDTAGGGYTYAMTALPAASLIEMYERYGQQMLESNVRSYLKLNRPTNKKMAATIRQNPSLFTAYNNGLVIVADDVTIDGNGLLTQIINPRVVNGGQTTATLYHTKKTFPKTDVSSVWVPAKIIVPQAMSGQERAELIEKIAESSNTQTAIKGSDLSSRHHFHVYAEQAAGKCYLSDGVGLWFYERTTGAYDAMVHRVATTPAKGKQYKTNITPKKRVVKKGDIVKALSCWDGFPYEASKGNEKNLVAYFNRVDDDMQEKWKRTHGGKNGDDEGAVLDAGYRDLVTMSFFKETIAKHLIYVRTRQIVRSQNISGFPVHAVNYTVAVLALKYASQIDLMRVWRAPGQEVPADIAERIAEVAEDVAHMLAELAGGANQAEVAKRPQTWAEVKARFS